MPKIKLGRVEYTEGWVLIEPTIRELDAKIREAENDTHDRKRKCEALYPIFRISRSHYIYDLFYRRRKDISNELYVFCLDQGYADRNLIVKWKRIETLIKEKLVILECLVTILPDMRTDIGVIWGCRSCFNHLVPAFAQPQGCNQSKRC
ncbi:hypothetical protein VPH35_057608 [Triticum aestivum]|uniref:G10 protein n=1 Tax=Triticum aestivum TaxID=4565 RepID=A0A3B6GQ19_WHEAT